MLTTLCQSVFDNTLIPREQLDATLTELRQNSTQLDECDNSNKLRHAELQ